MTFNRHQDKSSSFTFYILVYWLCREFLFFIIFFSINPFLFYALSLTRVNRLNNLLPSIPEPRLAWFVMPPLSLSYIYIYMQSCKNVYHALKFWYGRLVKCWTSIKRHVVVTGSSQYTEIRVSYMFYLHKSILFTNHIYIYQIKSLVFGIPSAVNSLMLLAQFWEAWV